MDPNGTTIWLSVTPDEKGLFLDNVPLFVLFIDIKYIILLRFILIGAT